MSYPNLMDSNVMEISLLTGQEGCPSPGLGKRSGSGSPVQGGLTLSWHELSVWIKKKDMEKSNFISNRYFDAKILRKVSGVAEPGTLLAIMGPSGAGKTTLLATISQRLKGDVKGKLLVNGKELKKDLMMRISGFVPQHDLCIDSVTVMEHMQLMARLKMDKNTTKIVRTQRIWDLLRELGVYKCRHTKMSALSGGQAKRVSLAVQMLNDPGILFCDEPTTGLDSFNASSVIEQLRTLAARGKTVICTIHQPASGLFDMFHSVYLLMSGGKLGMTMPTHQVAGFLASVGLVCPPSYNIAEFIVSQLAVTEDLESRVRVGRVVRSFKDSKHYSDLVKRLDIQLNAGTPSQPTNKISNSLDSLSQEEEFKKYLEIKAPSKFTQFSWLLWRSAIDIIRKPKVQIIRFLFYMFIAFLISSPYVGFKTDQEGIQNLQGFLYLVVVETIFTFNYSVFHIFPSELPILLREIGNGLYSPGPYYLSKIIILLPRTVVEPVLYSALVFWIAGLFGGVYGFVQFCVPVVACSMVATAYGCLISTVFESVATGSLVSVPFENVTLTFCGIFLSLSDVPLHFAWVKYVSVFYYALEAISILQWTQIDTITCDPRPEVPCITSGRDVLKVYGYSPSNFGMDMLGMASLYCGFHIIGFMAFLKRSQKQAAY
uniref:Brown n=1 Tax=Limnogonus franciscanus TaxID=913166 RepID=A0A5C1YSX0_9HEMI|nr:brown [Limnogonus franciscanus]